MAQQAAPKKKRSVAEAINDMLGRVSELTAQEEFDSHMLERVFRLRDQCVAPIITYLRTKAQKPKPARAVEELFRAAEEYVVYFLKEPQKRDERRQKIDALKRRVRRELSLETDREAEVERLLDDIRQWQWKTTLDEKGRIAFAAGRGVVVPARSHVLRKVGLQVIDQAIKAQRPYSDEVRPRDMGGEPGGLVVLKTPRRLIVVGDLHGRYDNLEYILGDRGNLKAIMNSEAHLVFTGDAIHPASGRLTGEEAYEESFCVMLLIMTLKAENPFNVHYILGNHDNAHIGGHPLTRGTARPDQLLEQFFANKVSPAVAERYREFVRNCPAMLRAHAPDSAILLVHSTLSKMLIDEEGLINIFRSGRRGDVLEDLLWSRDFDSVRIERAAKQLGARFVVGSHTVPNRRNAREFAFEATAPPAFGQVGKVHLIINSQRDVFGYLDIDLTRPLGDDIGKLLAPDGGSACRMVRPKALPPEEAREE